MRYEAYCKCIRHIASAVDKYRYLYWGGYGRQSGYELEVRNAADVNHEVQTAEVILSYSYKFPVLGISQRKTTRGIAR